MRPAPRLPHSLALAAMVAISALPLGAQPRATDEGAGRSAAVDDARATGGRTAHAGAHDLAVYALGLVGASYKLGGQNPDDGLDCSGLVRHVFAQVGGLALPRTAREMSRVGGSVAFGELAPGDLVFFDTRRFAFSHVGIYVGDARFIHAPRDGRDVEIASLESRYWRSRFNGARRLSVAAAPRQAAAFAFADAAERARPWERELR